MLLTELNRHLHTVSPTSRPNRLSSIMCASRPACVSASVSARQEPTNHEKTPTVQLTPIPFLVVPRTQQQKPHPSDDSAALHNRTVYKVRELPCTQQTPHAHATSWHRRQVSCSCGHSLPRTHEPHRLPGVHGHPASPTQQPRSSDTYVKSEPPDSQGCCTLDRAV